jgi:hypothetical protein
MSILSCVESSPREKWYLTMVLLGCIFGIDFCISIFFFFLHRRILFRQRPIVISSQLCLIFAFFSKFITFSIAGPIHPRIPSQRISMIGLLLFETPCYVITTCYSLTLLSWLAVSLEYLPPRHQAFGAKGPKSVLIVNLCIYARFLVVLVLAGRNIGQENARENATTAVFVGRDAVMGITFLVFLKCGFGVSDFGKESSRGKRLFFTNIAFCLVLVLRAAVVAVQGWFLPREEECQVPFFVLFVVGEVVVDFVPMSLLMLLHAQHIRQIEVATTMFESIEFRAPSRDDPLLTGSSVADAD